MVVIWRRNPIESALALAGNLIAIAGFYLALQAQFIALLQVIVYAGAIMVLVLFVIMLLNLPPDPRESRSGFFQLWLTVGFASCCGFPWVTSLSTSGTPCESLMSR